MNEQKSDEIGSQTSGDFLKSDFCLTSCTPLAPLTTFHIGGPARFFIEAHTEEEIAGAIAFAKEQSLLLFVFGNGSNILVPDVGVDGVVLKMAIAGVAYEDRGESMRLIAEAGTPWEEVVAAAAEQNLFGIENLAGIPGTMGGAAVQNIGAYGAELADTFDFADCVDTVTGEQKRVNHSEAAFAYRTSFFKQHREMVVMRVALRLSKQAQPNLAYPDLVQARERGVPLRMPAEIACAIRAIRAEKFPIVAGEGTAGSFFKNPIVDEVTFLRLRMQYPDLPAYSVPAEGESADKKLPLAWLLDHALALKGFAKGRVRLYEKQPLVIVAQAGATAAEIDAFADEIAKRVFSATGITIEREVDMFGTPKQM